MGGERGQVGEYLTDVVKVEFRKLEPSPQGNVTKDNKVELQCWGTHGSTCQYTPTMDQCTTQCRLKIRMNLLLNNAKDRKNNQVSPTAGKFRVTTA